MTNVRLQLDSARHRRVYLVFGAPEIGDNTSFLRGAPRYFTPTAVEIEIFDDSLVTVWVLAHYPSGKRHRGRSCFSNYDSNVPALASAPEWVRNLADSVVPQWKVVDNG